MTNNSLITYLLNNNGKPKDLTWLEIAKKFEIRPELDDLKRSKAVNDLWRNFVRKDNKDLDDFTRGARIKSFKRWQGSDGTWKQSVAYENNRVINDINEVKKAISKTISEYEIPSFEPKYGSFNNICAVINLYDAHLSKMSLINDTNEYSDTDVAVEKFRKAFDELLTTASAFKPELIVIPFGNDYLHENSSNNTTKRGTPLDVFGNHYDNFSKALTLIRECIDKASQVAKVFIPTVVGNHDPAPTIYISTALAEIYKDSKVVEVDNRRITRKYLRFGCSLLGFTHGDTTKMEQLPLLMAIETGTDFANTTERIFLTGHVHHLQTKEFPGVVVRSLRSVSSDDSWHNAHGFVGSKKSANVMLFESEEGLKAEFSVNIK